MRLETIPKGNGIKVVIGTRTYLGPDWLHVDINQSEKLKINKSERLRFSLTIILYVFHTTKRVQSDPLRRWDSSGCDTLD